MQRGRVIPEALCGCTGSGSGVPVGKYDPESYSAACSGSVGAFLGRGGVFIYHRRKTRQRGCKCRLRRFRCFRQLRRVSGLLILAPWRSLGGSRSAAASGGRVIAQAVPGIAQNARKPPPAWRGLFDESRILFACRCMLPPFI